MSLIDTIRGITYPPVEQTVTARDAMLYGLGLGFGSDPCDARQLQFVFEKELRVFPSMAITLCYPSHPGASSGARGLDVRQVLHVSQGFELLAPVPLNRPLVGQHRITGVYDKGKQRGVLWTYENVVRERDGDVTVCVLKGASISRTGGGSGGPKGESPPKREFPRRTADAVADIRTLPQAALIYRLSGDFNALHADPVVAREGGFRQPILHGRCTFGVAARALVETMCAHDSTRLRAMEARFSAPVYPGETLRTEIWVEGGEAIFRCTVLERDLLVLDQGCARMGESTRESQ